MDSVVSSEDGISLSSFNLLATVDDDGVSSLSDESVDVDTEVTIKAKVRRYSGGDLLTFLQGRLL